jgi:hypothetical protein
MTARIPVTPDTRERLRNAVEDSDAETYDDLLRSWIQDTSGTRTSEKAQGT